MNLFALRRGTLREASQVSAVVVNHEIFLNPSQSSSTWSIKLIGVPCTVRESAGRLGTTRRSTVRPSTGIGLEVSIVCGEGRLSPVSFDQSTSCSPVISIPEARVNPHGLALGKWNSN
jgi:hypothetical protein